jgi:predicted enzyme related to lactoylglutathione lyase
MGKVVGVGGVFLRVKDPKGLQKWYAEHLGIPLEHGMSVFEGPESAGQTVFQFFPFETEQAVVNLRVDALADVLDRLEAAGVRVDPKREDTPFGKFGWFWDPEGNRVELWEAAEE